MQVHTNAHKYAQNFEKFHQETLEIDEVKCINKLATICVHKLDEVKCRNKYLEMNRPTRFKGEKLVYILIGEVVCLDKEKKIK